MWTGAPPVTNIGDPAKPTAVSIHEAIQRCWQEKSQWPVTEEFLQALGPENCEQLNAMQASMRTALGRLRDWADEPAIFLLFKDWAKGFHPSLLEHKDVQVLVALYFSYT